MGTFNRKEYVKQYSRERRAYYHAHGICYNCGEVYAEPGHVLCKTCARKNQARAKRSDPDGEKHKQYVKVMRDQRRAAGLCIDCGMPVLEGHTRCAKCVEKRRESTRVYKLRKKIRRQNEQERKRLIHEGLRKD